MAQDARLVVSNIKIHYLKKWCGLSHLAAFIFPYFFCHQVVHIFIYFLGEPGIQTHVPGSWLRLWVLKITTRQGVNFINIIRTNFLYERRFSSYFLAFSKNLYEKRACMTLMKLTTGSFPLGHSISVGYTKCDGSRLKSS